MSLPNINLTGVYPGPGLWSVMDVYRRAGAFAPTQATGGTVTEITDAGLLYRVHTFSTVGTSSFNVTSVSELSPTVEYLVIAGGGSGGSYTGAAYVGGNPGSNSVFGPITSQGGGGGKAWNVGSPNPNGGSSGGGGGNTTAPGTPTAGQGFSGGTGQVSSGIYGGGGGGAGGVGANAATPNNGDGGVGVQSLITGVATFRGGGGGGGSASGVRGDGGLGGGGNGGIGSGAPPVNGTANTGGGGGSGDVGVGAGHGGGGAGGYRCSVLGEQSGGGASAESPLAVSVGSYSVSVGAGGVSPGAFAAAGGSGVVIIRYPIGIG